MEQNRKIDFDSDVEVDNLKDVVWRLTTRVYLLEDFIVEKFGEVLTPSGFTKFGHSSESNVSAPETSAAQTSKVETFAESRLNSRPTRRSQRKRRKHSSTAETGGGSNKVQKTLDNKELLLQSNNNPDCVGTLTSSSSCDGENNDSSLLLIPKDEVTVSDFDDSDSKDDFLKDNNNSDDEREPNDSLEQDPDFVPELDANDLSNNPKTKVRVRRGRQTKKRSGKDKNVSTNSEEKPFSNWEKWQTFENEDDAKRFLKEEDEWRCNRTVQSTTSKSAHYYCKIDRKCQTRRYLVQKQDSQTVELYGNSLPHDHDCRKRLRKRMNEKVKEIIDQLMSEGCSKPQAVMKALTKPPLGNTLTMPTKAQVTNYMLYRKRLKSTQTNNHQELAKS